MKRYLIIVALAAVYVSAVMGYYEKGKANILVVWEGDNLSAATEQSPSFDLLNRLRFGNPLWFID